jgi:formylglycine-generating enzyme required for sulfatase activity
MTDTTAPTPGAPAGSGSAGRVIRGGSWVDPSDFLRASWRDVNPPTTANFCTGFRVARNP